MARHLIVARFYCQVAERDDAHQALLAAEHGQPADLLVAHQLRGLGHILVLENADDVRRHLSGEGVKARGDSNRYRLWKFVGRHRLRLGAAAAIATTLIVAAVAGWVVYRDKRIQSLRYETLSRIVALQKKTDFAAAYRLLRSVESELAGDPELERTRQRPSLGFCGPAF